MKRIAIFAVLLLAASVARADTIVQVVLNPTPLLYPVGAPGAPLVTFSVGGVFDWDVTTGLVSNGVGFTSGPYFQNMTTQFNDFTGFFLNFSNAVGDIFQLNYGNHGGFIPPLTGATGTFPTDLWVDCAECTGDSTQQQFLQGTATVTAFTDPVSTPEPGGLLLLGVGLVGLLAVRLR